MWPAKILFRIISVTFLFFVLAISANPASTQSQEPYGPATESSWNVVYTYETETEVYQVLHNIRYDGTVIDYSVRRYRNDFNSVDFIAGSASPINGVTRIDRWIPTSASNIFWASGLNVGQPAVFVIDLKVQEITMMMLVGIDGDVFVVDYREGVLLYGLSPQDDQNFMLVAYNTITETRTDQLVSSRECDYRFSADTEFRVTENCFKWGEYENGLSFYGPHS